LEIRAEAFFISCIENDQSINCFRIEAACSNARNPDVRIARVEIYSEISGKNRRKHSVQDDEVREVFRNGPKITFIEKGRVENENVYRALGKAQSGRFLVIIFIYKKNQSALVLSARDMTAKERKRYAQK